MNRSALTPIEPVASSLRRCEHGSEDFGGASEYIRRTYATLMSDGLAPPTVSAFLDGHGRPHYLYEYGISARPAVVLLPPAGVSYSLLYRLAVALSKDFHVISWESRGCPNTDVALSEQDLELQIQAADFAAILASRGIHEFHFVGWCQAAQHIILACHSNPSLAPLSLSLIAPAGLGYSVLPSEFDRCALPVYLRIAQCGIEYAAKIREVLQTSAHHPNGPDQVAERLSLWHLASPEGAFRYGRYMKAFVDSIPIVKPLVSGAVARVRTQVIHCKDDTFSHYSESVQLARDHRSIRLELLPSGGHLFVFKHAEATAETVGRFIADIRGERVAS